MDKTLIVISHDRYFLDKVVTRIWEMSSRGLKVYEGNYTAYKAQKDIEIKNNKREYEKQQQKIRQLRQAINERKNWFITAHRAAGQNDFYRSKAKKHSNVLKAKEKELERIEKNRVTKPEEKVTPAFDIINKNTASEKLSPVPVRVNNLRKSYGDKLIYDDVSINIMRQDKIALIGPNGAGKTTFLKILCGRDDSYEGTVSVNPSVKIGYFAQELDNLNDDAVLLDEVSSLSSSVEETRLLLVCLLFKGDDVYKKISSLSMGEKCRVAFAKLILSGANLLVMDEPTNYLDIESREKIEDILGDFKGSVIFVSHDI